jgi:hypothetical protein
MYVLSVDVYNNNLILLAPFIRWPMESRILLGIEFVKDIMNQNYPLLLNNFTLARRLPQKMKARDIARLDMLISSM